MRRWVAVALVAAACSSTATMKAVPASCADAVTSGSVATLMAAFERARVLGRGAEACLAEQAAVAYCGPRPCTQAEFDRTPGPLCLYSCNGYAVKKLTWHEGAGGAVEVLTDFAEAQVAQGRPPSSIEHLQLRGNVIVQATTSA